MENEFESKVVHKLFEHYKKEQENRVSLQESYDRLVAEYQILKLQYDILEMNYHSVLKHNMRRQALNLYY